MGPRTLGVTMKIGTEPQSSGEIAARVFHVVIGLLLLGVAGWFLFYVSPFNPYGFFGFFVFGAVPLLVGFFGSRKTVFQLLLLGWV